MKSQTPNPNIQILEPVIERDFREAIKLVEDNIVLEKNFDINYFKSLSSGEILVAKLKGNLVGVLTQRRPGKIFHELDDKFFALDKINVPKKDIGYEVLVAIDSKYQGKGIGKKLVEKALKLQKGWGAKCVGVHCWQGSPGNGSQKLFEYFGFEPIKAHKSSWEDHSRRVGPKEYWCVVCGNPCICDELEMVKYL